MIPQSYEQGHRQYGGFVEIGNQFRRFSENPCIFAAHIFDNENLCGYLFFDTFIAGHIRPFCFPAQEKMAVAAVELAANTGGHSVCAGLLGHQYPSVAALQGVLLYINMYSAAEAGLYGCVHPFPADPHLLERGGEGGIARFACLHFCCPCCDDLRMHGRAEKAGGE